VLPCPTHVKPRNRLVSEERCQRSNQAVGSNGQPRQWLEQKWNKKTLALFPKWGINMIYPASVLVGPGDWEVRSDVYLLQPNLSRPPGRLFRWGQAGNMLRINVVTGNRGERDSPRPAPINPTPKPTLLSNMPPDFPDFRSFSDRSGAFAKIADWKRKKLLRYSPNGEYVELDPASTNPGPGVAKFRSTLTSSLVNSSRPSGRLFYWPRTRRVTSAAASRRHRQSISG
jgi:hypothetical protein